MAVAAVVGAAAALDRALVSAAAGDMPVARAGLMAPAQAGLMAQESPGPGIVAQAGSTLTVWQDTGEVWVMAMATDMVMAEIMEEDTMDGEAIALTGVDGDGDSE